MKGTILELDNIKKSFLSVKALEGVSFDVNKGEVHGLIGENGAGKSTLIKILAGLERPDEGSITIEGQRVSINHPKDAKRYGLSFIHQELYQVPNFSVAENLFLGRDYPKNKFKLIKRKKMNQNAIEFLKKFNIEEGIEEKPIEGISMAYRYILAIEKAIYQQCKIIFMDEPTASLTKDEVDRLFKIITDLKETGISIVYVSHKLEEIFQICDRVTVLREGKKISTDNINETSMDKVIFNMLGETLSDKFPKEKIEIGDELLTVSKVESDVVQNTSFNLHKGEILGFIGLVGSGRTELARLIFGLDNKMSGNIYINGKEVNNTNPRRAIDSGICLTPEDRQNQGLVLNMDIAENITLSNLYNYCIGGIGLIQYRKERKKVEDYVSRLRINANDISEKVKQLSGGNQQKVVIARGVDTSAKVFIFDEPTKGVDVGAKTEIYLLMQRLAKQGNGVIFISSEVEEIMGITDRFFIMHKGKVVGEYKPDEISADKIAFIMQRGGK